MKKLQLRISGNDRARTAPLAGLWIVVLMLVALTTYQWTELESAHEVAFGSASIASAEPVTAIDRPTETEMRSARFIESHMAARLADWDSAFSTIAGALSSDVTLERLTLGAKLRKGELILRSSRIEDVARTVETLETAPDFDGTSIRRCEPARSRESSATRCDVGFSWILRNG